ncbi:MAG: class I SAM-dependent RNA methyltransferase [Clostridia bacterium]|nr:class I SAM-dependent RNA methyltransferase [Clostridia bacterium]
MTLVATCLFGLEKLLGEEIDSLGCKRILTMDGRIFFEGDERAIVRANLRLRLAEHVFVLLGSFSATTFTELFDGVAAIPLEEWIGKEDAFPVKGHSIKSRLFSVPDCQSIIKKAAVTRLSGAYGIKIFPETGAKYQLEFFLFKDIAYIMLDTTGIPLHKRGYRPESGLAPLRETLAAAIVLTSRPRADVLFWDPMCGSGTIAIEAAEILHNIAPGLSRTFAAEDYPRIPKTIWTEEREAAKSEIVTDNGAVVWASDIDPEMVSLAKENAKRAWVEKFIRVFQADVRKIQKEDCRGTIVCNPPYGERLMTSKEVETLYREMGKNLRSFAPWQLFIITSHPQFEKCFGRRADKEKKLVNGRIPCALYEFLK